ncbi:hypothetical protein Bca52824_004375, partial [Brassica carinata]
MANPQILLADLSAGRCSDTAEVRLLRFWEARNVRRGGELMSIDRLSEGSIYTLSGFDVTRSSPNLRLSDTPFSIRFNNGTSLEKKTASSSGESVCVSIFDSMALAFHTKLDSYGKEPRVIIATSLNPKIVGGSSPSVSSFLFHSAMYSAGSVQSPSGIGVDARVDTDLPRCLADIVGKTYTLQLKLNDFNFSSKHQTFTISRIVPQRALAPMPAFARA